MTISNDIATALYERLTADGYSASAHVIPAALEAMLPHVHIEVVSGGPTSDRVIEDKIVDFDVYADTIPDAEEEVSYLCGWVRALEGTTVGTPCYTAEVINRYKNPDPRHPNIGRATLRAQITVRVKEV